MSTRSTRRSQPNPSLTSIESLLLAQATWQSGAAPSSWPEIAKLLSKHPLLSRPKSFFTAQSCHSMYENLMKEAGLEVNESNNVPRAPLNLKLAEKQYHSRFQELRQLIMAEESKFKTVLKEIEDIRAGLWDKQIQEKTFGGSPTEPSKQEEDVAQDRPSDEVFGGSDLSGVTESAESASPSQTREDLPASGIATLQDNRQITSKEAQDEQQAGDHEKMSSPTPTVEISEDISELNAQGGDNQSKPMESREMTVPAETAETKIPSPVDEDISIAPPDNKDVAKIPEADQTEGLQVSEKGETSTQQSDEGAIEHVDQRQEEEEEEVNQEEESKQEEEEASQGQEDDGMNIDQTEDQNTTSPKSSEDVDMDTESEPVHTPAADTVASEIEPVAEAGQSSGTEERVIPTRRSSRRRKSSAASVPPPTTRTRLRSRAHISESEPQNLESENDVDAEIKEDTPVEDEQVSSPFESGIGRRRDGKRKASFIDGEESSHDKKRLREDSEPAEEEEPEPTSHNTRARVTRNATRTEEQVALKRFQNVISMLHSQISQHRNGNIFHNPIKNSEAPDYHEIVKRPMDLKTIKTRIKDGVIGNSLEFQRDIYLMFANAMMYNRPGSDVHAMAEDMMLESEGQIIAFRQTEGLVKRGQRA